ncbi:MAG: right-handed parallel beta-helix repeat-containing protein [Actinobacteria bacterium]|nr:right-handed parallel beta-helix repeat-containing protein [Actinomycetota bacterium]
MRHRWLLIAAAVVVTGVASVWAAQGGTDPLVLSAGTHGPLTLDTSGQVVRAEDGALLRGPVIVAADDVRLEGLSIIGGDTGVLVRDVDGVVIDDVTIRGAGMHGIEVVDASATITGCHIAGMGHPLAQGIEIRNQTGRPHTIVEGCSVVGGKEGIVAHSARVQFLRNEVTATGVRAIAILEMSEGIAAGNRIHEVVGAGLFCGDMSHCEFRDNTVAGVASDDSGVANQAGYGSVTWYYSTVRHTGNAFTDVAAPTPITLRHGSVEVERFPLSIWPPGWGGVLPGLPIALAAAGAVLLAVTFGLRRWRGDGHRGAPVAEGGALALLGAGLAVQTMHMSEHAVQVWQIHVADAEVRAGLLGQAFNTEWVHLSYNLAVMMFMLGLIVRERDGLLRGGAWSWFAGATAIQTWHLAEHVAKVFQHEALGIKVAPGIIGDDLGLVWFHFGINTAVWAGQVIALVIVLRALGAFSRAHRSLEPVPA